MNAGDAVEWFLIVAALLAGVSGLVVLAAAAIAPLGNLIRPMVAGQELVLAMMCGVGMMGGSLFLSEVQGYNPCQFCWYQRFAAYPLAVMLVVATVRRRGEHLWPHALSVALALPGGALSLYHIALQEGLIDEEGTSCDPYNPCTAKWAIDDKLGWMTIPTMALCGFVFIGAMAVTAMKRRSIAMNHDDPTDDPTDDVADEDPTAPATA